VHVAVFFENIGGYHAARLRAVDAACREKGWRFTAIQITNAQGDYAWDIPGSIITFPIRTVLARADSRGPLTPDELRASGPALVALLEELAPDAVAIPGWGFSYSRAALAWCRRRRVGAVLMSDSKRDDQKRVWWKEWWKSRLVRKFQAALVAGASHRDYLVKLGIPRERIFFGYDVVDNDYFSHAANAARQDLAAARARQPLIPRRPYFLAVTRLIPRKNAACLLEAYLAYRASAGEADAWDLVICGNGTEEPRMRNFIREHKLDWHVHMPGFISYSGIGDWYGLAKAFIHPALQEQWGLAVNEAMAAGVPALVSNRCGCYPELVRDGEAALGFDPERTEQLADLMLKCWRGEVDLERVARAAAQHIRNFTPRHFAEGLLAAASLVIRQR
jgi:glycosyltransferase involved in cell wall biosynthesis